MSEASFDMLTRVRGARLRTSSSKHQRRESSGITPFRLDSDCVGSTHLTSNVMGNTSCFNHHCLGRVEIFYIAREALLAIPRWNAFEVSDHSQPRPLVECTEHIRYSSEYLLAVYSINRPLMRQRFPNHQSPEAYFYEVLWQE